MEGGVRQQDTPIERTGNMENLIDAEMAREDLGRMTYMSLEVRKKLFVCLTEAIILFVVSYWRWSQNVQVYYHPKLLRRGSIKIEHSSFNLT